MPVGSVEAVRTAYFFFFKGSKNSRFVTVGFAFAVFGLRISRLLHF